MKNQDRAKKLFFDIETSANVALTWGKYDQTVPHFVREWEVLSISYCWEINGKRDKIENISRLDHNYATDKDLMRKFGKLLDEADMIIAHNGRKFDLKKINSRIKKHNLPVPSSVKVIDTLEVFRRRFSLNSNKLNDIGAFLGLGKKVETGGIMLWVDCMTGFMLPGKVIKKSWRKMIKYNNQDVVLLMAVYDNSKAWINGHPSVTLYGEKPGGCPTCGGTKLKSKGWEYTKTSAYRRFVCTSCGSTCRSRTADKTRIKPDYVPV